jgi:hypothetical protein
VINGFKNRFKTIISYSFLILFLGYYGSITLFYHSHIVLGDTIVHSHPYKTNGNGLPSHSHSEKGYITIQLLSVIVVSFIFAYFSFKAIAPVAYEISPEVNKRVVIHHLYSLSLLRAPPSDLLK